MANNSFLPTSFTVTSTFATLASYLATSGFPDVVNNFVSSYPGYIANEDGTINVQIGFGTVAPTSFETLLPKTAIPFVAGMNPNLVWIRAASSTVVVGFAEGANAVVPASISLTSATLAGTTTFTGLIQTATGTATVAPINMPAGTVKTSPAAGDEEFDGASFYATTDTTSGRGAVDIEQYFRLTATGGTISTVANYFGTTSNISLVASAFYEIDIFAWFLNTTSGTLTWTLLNSAAPTAQDIYYEMSPITGIVAPPGTATMLDGQIYADNTASLAVCTTGTLTTAVNHFMHMKIWLQNGTGTSLKIQATKNVGGTITPGIGSRWFCRRLPAASTGTFAA